MPSSLHILLYVSISVEQHSLILINPFIHHPSDHPYKALSCQQLYLVSSKSTNQTWLTFLSWKRGFLQSARVTGKDSRQASGLFDSFWKPEEKWKHEKWLSVFIPFGLPVYNKAFPCAIKRIPRPGVLLSPQRADIQCVFAEMATGVIGLVVDTFWLGELTCPSLASDLSKQSNTVLHSGWRAQNKAQ